MKEIDEQFLEQNSIYNKTELLNKLFEPSNVLDDGEKGKRVVRVTRNHVLGNIQRDDLLICSNMHRTASLLRMVPKNQGGFLFDAIANLIDTDVQSFFVMSNSVGGKGRASGSTNIIKQEMREIKDKRGFGTFTQE